MKKLASIIQLVLILIMGSCSDKNDSPEPIPIGWQEISVPVQFNNFTDVEFYNNDFGVACGGYGNVIKTENGGVDWQKIDMKTDYSFVKVFILNENEFYTSRAGLFKTSDGGDSFSEIGDFSNASGFILEVHFFNSTSGIIYKNERILKTTDGGQNWDIKAEVGFCDIMKFPSKNIGYIAGGESWDGFTYGEMHKTIDGGNNWENLGTLNEIYESEITAMYFMSEDTGYISNFNREIYITKNGCKSWELKSDSIPEALWDMVFITKLKGYAIGYNSIYKTENGGITWERNYQNSNVIFGSITATPDKKIFAVGNGGVIFKQEP